MTEMAEFVQMDIDERCRCTFIPMGSNIYNGLGYMLGKNARVWSRQRVEQFHEWAMENDVRFDGAVYEFPDAGTYIMAKMIFE